MLPYLVLALAAVPLVEQYTCASVKAYYSTDVDSPSCCDTSDATSASGVLANSSDVFYTFPVQGLPSVSDGQPLCTITFTPRTMTTAPYFPEAEDTFALPLFRPSTKTLVSVNGTEYVYEKVGEHYFLDFHPMWENESAPGYTSIPSPSGGPFGMKMFELERTVYTVRWHTDASFQWTISATIKNAEDEDKLELPPGMSYDPSTRTIMQTWNGLTPDTYARRGYNTDPSWYLM